MPTGPPGLLPPLRCGDWCQLLSIQPGVEDGWIFVFRWHHQDGTIEIVSFNVNLRRVFATGPLGPQHMGRPF